MLDSRRMAARRAAILSTLFTSDPPMAVWRERVDTVRPRTSDLRKIVSIVARAPRYDAVVLDGSARRDQVAAALLRLWPRGPVLVIADATWKVPARRPAARARRAAIRILDGTRITFCVLSSFEVERFAVTWRLRHSRVRFTPWPFTLTESELALPAADNGRVFAGGNSLRDYDSLLVAAGGIGAEIDIATDALSPEQLRRCPANVTVRPIARDDYAERLRCAAVVVVPLAPRGDRSSGQTTYVNAMARGKALVITDAPGVRDYVADGQAGVIVPPGDSARMADAVRGLLEDPARRLSLGRAAREHALQELTMTQYAERLLAIAAEAIAASARG
jgi:hypothetical protein